VKKEIEALAGEGNRATQVVLDYGAPFEGEEHLCHTMKLERLYIDPDGKMSLCCQLSDYGFNTRDIVGDLNTTSLRDVYSTYLEEMNHLRAISAPPAIDAERLPIDAFPCLRCAKALGKLSWLDQFPVDPWAQAMHAPGTMSLHSA
jgi:hypothetical protein